MAPLIMYWAPNNCPTSAAHSAVAGLLQALFRHDLLQQFPLNQSHRLCVGDL
jgi:hypothetical protein